MKPTPLFAALQKHKNLNRASFHTPGHKNSKLFTEQNFFELDFTELPDTDSLYEANGVIKEAEVLATKLYESNCTFFSAGGCSLCIQTMLKLALPYGGKIVASRMIHKSAVNAMAILNADVKWIMPEFDQKNSCFKQVSAKKIEEILQKNSNISCVYITSPNYFGNIADVATISEICHKHKVPLLVDNAHGSHLKFLSKDIHPLALGADLVADSAHKTLPVLTGGAFLHIANEKFAPGVKQAMSIFGSTSPSYPILASLDVCSAWLHKNGKKAYSTLEKEVAAIKKIAHQKGLLDNLDENVDPIRLALHTAKVGNSGNDAADFFRKNGVEPEFSDHQKVVFIATPMNTDEDFSKLKRAIELISVGEPIQNQHPIFDTPIIKKSLHEAMFSTSENVNSVDSVGKISATTVCPCPPGIPILVPGELITENSIKNLLHYGIFSLDVIK